MTNPPIRVLLVDDHPVVRAGLRALLQGFDGVEVVGEASDGHQALAMIDDTIDVVVMDLEMPGMNGITATQHLMAHSGPPVLMLTTYDNQSDVLAAVDAGAKGYLLKDAQPTMLRQAIFDTAAGKPTFAPEITAMLLQRMQQPRTRLSACELEILSQLATGATNKHLAQSLFISEATVKTHLVHIFQKFGVTNRTAAIQMAREQRLI